MLEAANPQGVDIKAILSGLYREARARGWWGSYVYMNDTYWLHAYYFRSLGSDLIYIIFSVYESVYWAEVCRLSADGKREEVVTKTEDASLAKMAEVVRGHLKLDWSTTLSREMLRAREPGAGASPQDEAMAKARGLIFSWVEEHKGQFARRQANGSHTKQGTEAPALGVVDHSGSFVDIFPAHLGQVLSGIPHEANSLLKFFARRGWIKCNNGLRYNVSYHGKVIPAYRFIDPKLYKV